MKRVVLAVAIAALAVVVAVGGYLTLVEPSGQPILAGLKPIPAAKQAMMPVTPLSDLSEPERTRVADTLRGAAESVQPGHRIDEEQMFIHPGGWDALRKLTGEYLTDEFGLHQLADAEVQFEGRAVRYLIWGAGWPRTEFDDRTVVAVEYFDPVTPDHVESMLGYFVMRPT